LSRTDCAPGAVIKEGKALIYIPNPERAVAPHGLEPAWLDVFYNPKMIFNRDLSVATLIAYQRMLAPVKEFHIVEPLTATGVRAVRYAVEASTGGFILAGDIDECAVKIADLNVKLNNIENSVIVKRSDARTLLYMAPELLGKAPLYIDIDPFGSPAPYLQAALSVIGIGGLIGVTATDLAVLEGSKWKAARRKYMVYIKKVPESKEIGLRVLIGYAARIAATMDKWIHPIFAYYADHYYRVYFIAGRGASKADNMLEEKIGFAYYCPGENRTYLQIESDRCPSGEHYIKIGPLWTGHLNDASFLAELEKVLDRLDYIESSTRAKSLLKILMCEAEIESELHFRVEQAAAYAKRSMPKISILLDSLRRNGYTACRSHYSPTSLRSNASYMEVVRLISSLC